MRKPQLAIAAFGFLLAACGGSPAAAPTPGLSRGEGAAPAAPTSAAAAPAATAAPAQPSPTVTPVVLPTAAPALPTPTPAPERRLATPPGAATPASQGQPAQPAATAVPAGAPPPTAPASAPVSGGPVLVATPGPGEPGMPTPDSDRMAELAREALASQLNIPAAHITIVSTEPVEWRDGSLGCPKPGVMYLQVITPGYRVILEANGQRYEYHTDTRRQVVQCNKP